MAPGNLPALFVKLTAMKQWFAAAMLLTLAIEPGHCSAALVRYDIPAQSLNNALMQFAAESKLALMFSTDMIRGIQAEALQGEMTAEQALNRLLHNSGFSYRFVDATTVTLIPRDAAGATEEAVTATLETVSVVEHAPPVVKQRDSQIFDEAPQSYRASNAISATRTDTPVMQIPQSIHTIKRSLIDDQKNITVSEALYNVSGVVPRNVLYTPSTEGTLVRGFRTEQLLDGFTQYYNPGDRESMVNLERIEVLKGGNAVLFGGGSGSPVGGVINLLSKLPQQQSIREFGFTMGSHAFYQPYFDFNQALTENALFRITGEYTESANFIGSLETERYNVNPALTFSNHDSTVLTLLGRFSRWRQPDYQGLPATGTIAGHFQLPANTYIGPANIPDSHSNSDSASASLDHRFNSVWSLNLKSRYAASEFAQQVQSLVGSDGFAADKPLLPTSTWALANTQLSQQQTEYSVLGNLQAKFELGAADHTLLLGADYSHLDDVGFINADFVLSGLNLATIDLSQPSFPRDYRIPKTSFNDTTVNNQTYGGYLQWQSSWYHRFHQLLSLRMGGMAIDYLDRAHSVTATTQTLRPLPRIGSVFDINDSVSIFASYSEGMRGQPFFRFSGPPLPELSRQLEGGFKFDFSSQLSGQIAVYRIERSQVAVAAAPGSTSSVAEGQQRSQGFETDLIWQPHSELGILANYAHTDASFSDALAGVAKGNRLAMVPEDAGRLWANYRFPQAPLQGFSVGLGVNVRSGAYLSNNNAFKTGGYHSFDAALSYDGGSFKVSATAKNLSDSEAWLPYGYFSGRVAPSGGPSVFISASVKF